MPERTPGADTGGGSAVVTAQQWYAEATTPERRFAGAVALTFLLLVALAVVPERPEATAVATGVTTDGVGVAPTSTVPNSHEEPTGPSEQPTRTAAVTSEATTAPSAVGDSTATLLDPGAVAATTTTTGPAVMSTTQVARAASDRGVTENQITLGFTVFDAGGVQSAGIGLPNIRHDIPEVIEALVADANRRGGVHGRHIVPVTKFVDVVSVEDQKAKCEEFANDDQVFAVIDTFAFIYRTTRDCVTQDNHTPLLTSLAGSRDELLAHAPYQASAVADDNVIAKNWVYGALEDGFFDPANGFEKLGIFSDNCDRMTIDDPEIGLKRYLNDIGIDEWSEFIGDCDVSAFQRAGAQAVLQHRSDGVTHVLHVTPGVAVAGYLRTAQTQGYHPEYFVSDYLGLTSDGIVIDFEAEQWDGVRAVTATHNGETAIGKPINANAQRCSDALVAAGLAPIDDYSEDFEAIYLCESLELFLAAARLSPINLTRLDWGAAVPGIGTFPSAWVDRAIFEPGVRAGGGRTLAIVRWSAECRCYEQVRPHQELSWSIDR